MTSEDFKMKKLHISRALRAALIGIAVIGSAGIAHADIKDYKFELVDQSVQAGPDKVIAVRLMNTKTGKIDRKSTRLNSSHTIQSRMPSSA